MKTRKHVDRKTGIDVTLIQMRKFQAAPHECQQAWRRLIRELEFMSDAEARMPRFNRLMHALWIAATNDQLTN